MISPDPLINGGCDPAIAKILATDIERGWSDATAYVGPCFADYQGVAIQNQINSGKGDAEVLQQLGIAHEFADALAKAINAATLERA